MAATPSLASEDLIDSDSPPAYVESISTEKVVLLYVGRISWEKNLRLLVEACRGLEKASVDGTRPACQLVFVGEGPSRPELEVLCRSYGLDAIFMGYRKGEELAAAYASADIFAFPSWYVELLLWIRVDRLFVVHVGLRRLDKLCWKRCRVVRPSVD